MIRLVLGFLITFGTVGAMEMDPQFSVLQGLLQAAAGLALMAFGAKKVIRNGGFE